MLGRTESLFQFLAFVFFYQTYVKLFSSKIAKLVFPQWSALLLLACTITILVMRAEFSDCYFSNNRFDLTFILTLAIKSDYGYEYN